MSRAAGVGGSDVGGSGGGGGGGEDDVGPLGGVYRRLYLDGKGSPSASPAAFLGALLVGVPLWLTVLLPLTAICQAALAVLPGRKKGGGAAAGSARPGEEGEEDDGGESFPSPSDLKPREERRYDVVLLGATGFAGKLAALHMAETYGGGGGPGGKKVRWALAGRSRSKLEAARLDLAARTGNDDVSNVDIIVADTNVRSTLRGLVEDARAVITTVGPFCKYGSNVVEYCARYGTHYADITGESDWVRRMIVEWDDTARRTGAVVVSLCGNDCVPWDLTVHRLERLLRERCDDDLVEVECVDEVRGSISGGTIATMLLLLAGDEDAGCPRYQVDPFLRMPDGSASDLKTKARLPIFPARSGDRVGRFASRWTVPFIMSQLNAEVVKRSHALGGRGAGGGGTNLTYRESQVVPDFKTAFVSYVVLGMFLTAALNPVTRALLGAVLPKPGEGPSEEEMAKGYLCVSGFGVGAKGNRVESVMYFPNDPGYKDTARMLVESGLCLALDGDGLPAVNVHGGGGFYTPAAAMGDALLDRLCRTGTGFASRLVEG